MMTEARTGQRGKARHQLRGHIDHALRVEVNLATWPVAAAAIEANPEDRPPTLGLEQGKKFAKSSKWLNVHLVASANGYLFVEYDRFTSLTSPSRPMAEFPTLAACDPATRLRTSHDGMIWHLASSTMTPRQSQHQDQAAQGRQEHRLAAQDPVHLRRDCANLGTTIDFWMI